MVEMYRLVKENGMSYSEAITETKHRFIKGEFGEELEHPFFWAPFVYYGKP